MAKHTPMVSEGSESAREPHYWGFSQEGGATVPNEETTTVRCDILTRKRLRQLAANGDTTIQELLRSLAEREWRETFREGENDESRVS